MTREEAARYVGIGVTLFDEMVKDGRMPRAVKMNARVVWDRIQLDAAFTALTERSANRIDAALRGEPRAA